MFMPNLGSFFLAYIDLFKHAGVAYRRVSPEPRVQVQQVQHQVHQRRQDAQPRQGVNFTHFCPCCGA